MMTLSGRLITPINSETPTVTDVAVGLGKMPRFGGQTIRWWPVLLHSLACFRIAEGRTSNKNLLLYVLWHDAHEFATGDVPSTWKTPDLERLQSQLDLLLYPALLNLPYPDQDAKRFVKEIDLASRYAEAWEFTTRQLTNYFGVYHEPPCTEAVREVAMRFPSYNSTGWAEAPAVRHFKRLTETLMSHEG